MEIEMPNPAAQKLELLIPLIASARSEVELEDAVSSARLILESLPVRTVLTSENLRPLLTVALDHSNSTVKRLALGQLDRAADSADTVSLLDDPDLLERLHSALGGPDTAVADRVSHIFVKMARHQEGQRVVFHNNSVSQLKKIASSSDINKFRVLDLFARLSSLSAATLQLCEASGFLAEMTASVSSPDPLEQLNGVELLVLVSKTHEGAAYLEQSGTLAALKGLLSSSELDASLALLVPKIVQFFGELASAGNLELALLERNGIVPLLHRVLLEYPSDAKMAAIAALGHLASSYPGLQLMSPEMIADFVSAVNERDEDVRVTAMQALGAALRTLSKSRPVVPELAAHLQSALRSVPTRRGPDAVLNVLLPALDAPFARVHIGVYDVVQGLAAHPWGVELVLKYPGFYDRLLIRNINAEKNTVEWQYAIVETIVRTAKANPQLLPPEKLAALERYVKQGVFFVKTEAQVEIATMEAV